MFSTVVQRLHMKGGVAVTVEDPIEQQLSGAHGDGYMFQFRRAGSLADITSRFCAPCECRPIW
ncbi:hypothetical protein [Cupriavidus pinatubonensis]|uniref:hypothetical protein n=1 Tax=Cupriavidus pinatubonensis TaxID=248026 RepID=UPI003CC8E158